MTSDALGLSMLVDALANPFPAGATESTVLGPFYVPGSPVRGYGESIAEEPAGTPAWVYGRVLGVDGAPVPGAELDVWQNGDNRLDAVQDPDAPEEHLRGRFRAREDGTYAFLGVRPVPYPIPDDGPVGRMLERTGRHPWRPAHLHMIVSYARRRTAAASSATDTEPSKLASIRPSRPTRKVYGSVGRRHSLTQRLRPFEGLLSS